VGWGSEEADCSNEVVIPAKKIEKIAPSVPPQESDPNLASHWYKDFSILTVDDLSEFSEKMDEISVGTETILYGGEDSFCSVRAGLSTISVTNDLVMVNQVWQQRVRVDLRYPIESNPVLVLAYRLPRISWRSG
jgi:hypothetical protein